MSTDRAPLECGYQDVECWERQLRAAGWRPWNIRTRKESSGSTTWKAPSGLFYRGPYKAWKVMRDQVAEDEGLAWAAAGE
jgi:hypothetical protein